MPITRSSSSRPCDGFVEVVISERLHLGLDEVLRETRCQAGQLGICDERDPAYVTMMVAHEFHVAEQAPEILPAWELARVDHESPEIAMGFDPSICGQRERVEVLRAQGLFDFDDDHPEIGK